MAEKAHRQFKDRLYAQYARIGKALGNPARLEILELLAQSERTVESLVDELGLSTANTSQHLQVLRGAGLAQLWLNGVALVAMGTILLVVAAKRFQNKVVAV